MIVIEFVPSGSADANERIEHALHHLIKLQELTMSAISDYVAKQTAFNTQMDADISSVASSTADISTELAALNKTIADLQASSGAVTAADQALLDQATAQGTALQVKTDAAAAALKALDTVVAPVAPAAP